MAKLSSKLPDGDGLSAADRMLCGAPGRVHVVIALIDTKAVTVNVDDGTETPTVRIRRIEIIDEVKDLAERMLQRAIDMRTGEAVLPLGLEDELTELFKNVDQETGEILGGDEQ